MTGEPHLIFAEVSLDISRGEYRAALDKLAGVDNGLFPESYIMHLLHARALRGLGRLEQAIAHLKHCCRIAPSNQIAWQELIEVTVLESNSTPEPLPEIDPVADEFEQLSIALSGFQAPRATENSDPTPIAEQQKPFPDDASIAVPTESLARLFIAQGAYKKAIRVYTSLIQLKPSMADEYRRSIDRLLEKL